MRLPTFREAYARRLPIDSFYEWKATGGGKQPYAIAMKDRAPFGLAALWENWRDPKTGQWVRTFAIITVPANELLRDIHPRMPAILAPEDYDRWLGQGPDPREALRSYPADMMTIWPISARVNSHKNDDADVLTCAEISLTPVGGDK